MRLRPRPTVKETWTGPPENNDGPPDGVELPRKAQRLLGTKVQVNVSNGRDHRGDDFREQRTAGSKNPDSRRNTKKAPEILLPRGITGRGITDMPSWSNAPASNRSSSDILPTAATGPGYNGTSTARNGSSNGVRTSQFYPGNQRSIESMNREYYDASKQPLYVSQQTSASAVRDMALRKGSPRVNEMTNERSTSAAKANSIANASSKSKKPRKLDLSSLFPRPSASQARLLSPAKYSQSPSAMTEGTEFFPQEMAQAELRRKASNGRLEMHKSEGFGGSDKDNTPRVKIFEPDIYDNTRTNSRKPPKGIKNWFDGFDISSDEEEEMDPVELPANPPRPPVEAIPSDFSPYGLTGPEGEQSKNRRSSRPVKHSQDMLGPAKAIMARRKPSRSSGSSTVTEDSNAGRKRSGESRMAFSRLDSQSVLSISSGSEDEQETMPTARNSHFALEDETTLGANLPSPVSRKPDNTQGHGASVSSRTNDRSGSAAKSNRGKTRDSADAPMVVEDQTEVGEEQTKRSHLEHSNGSGVEAPGTKSRTSNRSGQEREGVKSPGGETTSSAPSDASRFMAVTEEEMMLLELMRSKRAAMQKNSFRQGYRLALEQEQDYLTKRRQTTNNSASRTVDEGVDQEGQYSSAEDETETGLERSPGKQQPATSRYSVFRKQDVDKGFKIDRFLAMAEAVHDEPQREGASEAPEHSSESEANDDEEDERDGEKYVAKMARMERFLMMKPSLADAIQENRPLSGTEIETDTMTDTEDEYAPSPMQRLLGISRDALRSPTPRLDEEDSKQEDSETNHDKSHHKVRALLSRHASGDPNLTALPQLPPRDEQHHPRPEKPRPALSPPIPEEAPPIPEINPPANASDMTALQPASKYQVRSRLVPLFASGPTLRKAPSPTLASPTSHTSSEPEKEKSEKEKDVAIAAASTGSRSPLSPRAPRRLDTAGAPRVTSMASSTSAGEDVLAAWAELGGGSDALGVRRRAW